MYVINGIAYAGDPKEPIRVKTVRPLDELCLMITFSTGEKRIYDATPLLKYPVYQPLKDKAVFDSVYIDCGTLSWNDGEIDIAPENLYEDSFAYEIDKKKNGMKTKKPPTVGAVSGSRKSSWLMHGIT